jgi:catechol 2,3-dioxygenase-like lactoylglutathione lyase family enzyme
MGVIFMSIEIIGLDHIQICIPIGEEATARHFYLDLLHFTEIEKPENLKQNGGFWCRAGTIAVHIGVEKTEKSKSKRHPAFIVSDIQATRRYLEENDIPIKEETPIPGVSRFSCFDPFLNRIEFLEYI